VFKLVFNLKLETNLFL